MNLLEAITSNGRTKILPESEDIMLKEELAIAIEPIVFELNKTQLAQLDKAFGVIHELLPEYYSFSGMASVQSINTKKLAKAEAKA